MTSTGASTIWRWCSWNVCKCVEHAIDNGSHPAIVECLRGVAAGVVVRIPQERGITHHHRRPSVRPIVPLIGCVGCLTWSGETDDAYAAGPRHSAFQPSGEIPILPSTSDGDEVAARRIQQREKRGWPTLMWRV